MCWLGQGGESGREGRDPPPSGATIAVESAVEFLNSSQQRMQQIGVSSCAVRQHVQGTRIRSRRRFSGRQCDKCFAALPWSWRAKRSDLRNAMAETVLN